jgi:tetratricopeptide (TPR) repeat protein
MAFRARDLLLGAATAGALAAGVVWAFWPARAALPPLVEARRLMAEGQLDAAADRALEEVRARPDEVDGHLVLSQVLDRPGPDARRVLERLADVHPRRRVPASLRWLNVGKASYRLARYDEAEAAWLAAVEADPDVPEAGWALLDLYYMQRRTADARRLALRLFETETDPHDRVQLLVDLLRRDAEPLAPGAVVQAFEAVARDNPKDLRSRIALGLALVEDSRVDEAIDLLGRLHREHPDDLDVAEAYLTAVAESDEPDDLAEALARLPAKLKGADRLAKFEGRVAQGRRDWEAAARAFRRAHEADPADRDVFYRLRSALAFCGTEEEKARFAADFDAFDVASNEGRAVFEEARAAGDALGRVPSPDLDRRIGDVRARMGRRDEAILWYRLALRDRPGDPAAVEALRRLGVAPEPVRAPE